MRRSCCSRQLHALHVVITLQLRFGLPLLRAQRRRGWRIGQLVLERIRYLMELTSTAICTTTTNATTATSAVASTAAFLAYTAPTARRLLNGLQSWALWVSVRRASLPTVLLSMALVWYEYCTLWQRQPAQV